MVFSDPSALTTRTGPPGDVGNGRNASIRCLHIRHETNAICFNRYRESVKRLLTYLQLPHKEETVPPSPQILLLIESSSAYGRGCLCGFARYARNRTNWILHHQSGANTVL